MATIMVEAARWRRISVGTLAALALASAALGLGTTAVVRSGGETVIREVPAARSVEAPGPEEYWQTSSAAVREQGSQATSPERCLESQIDAC